MRSFSSESFDYLHAFAIAIDHAHVFFTNHVPLTTQLYQLEPASLLQQSPV